MLIFARLWVRAHRSHRLLVGGAVLLGLSTASNITSIQVPTFYDPLLVPLVLVIVAGLTWQNAFPAVDAANPGLARARLFSVLLAAAFCPTVVWLCAEVSDKEEFLGTTLRSLAVSAGVYALLASVTKPAVALALTSARVLPAMVLLPAPGSTAAWVWWEYGRSGLLTAGVGAVCLTGLAVLVRRGPKGTRVA